jgi:hypothetical protein
MNCKGWRRKASTSDFSYFPLRTDGNHKIPREGWQRFQPRTPEHKAEMLSTRLRYSVVRMFKTGCERMHWIPFSHAVEKWSINTPRNKQLTRIPTLWYVLTCASVETAVYILRNHGIKEGPGTICDKWFVSTNETESRLHKHEKQSTLRFFHQGMPHICINV